ncbi:MAG: nucleotidyltransferase family protein [Ruminococcus sp.]|nr:nucleotidyltransferase family protein [Ruminococcus sp.]
MKPAGIVCEYNPMHNGHVWQIEKTHEAGATHIVCVMSGNFVQRGEPAFVDKVTRAEIAIHCGADLVVDLPVAWSCDSAANFAFGAVSLLDALGVKMLSFGSETADSALLKQCARCIDDPQVADAVKSSIAVGMTYPAALCEAVKSILGVDAASVISSPNSTLAIEYIRALKRIGSDAEICAVERIASAHDSIITSGDFASAAAIRSMDDFAKAKKYMPEYAFEKISKAVCNGFAVSDMSACERMILYALRMMPLDEMHNIINDESGIVQRIFNAAKTACSLDELLNLAKTKSITMARLRRCVMRLFLKIPDSISKKQPPYAKILAANQKGIELLSNPNIKIPIVTRHSEIMKLDEFSHEVYELQCRSTDLYMLMAKKIRACSVEQTSPVIINK